MWIGNMVDLSIWARVVNTLDRSPWSACRFALLHKSYFHFLWPLLLTGQGWVKGGSGAWHLLKRELKSPSRWKYLLCTGWWLWSLPELGTMGNEGERRSLTALFHSWKVGLRGRKCIYLIACRELQTVGMRIIQGSWVYCSDCPSSSESYFCLPCLCPHWPLRLECLSPGAVTCPKSLSSVLIPSRKSSLTHTPVPVCVMGPFSGPS